MGTYLGTDWDEIVNLIDYVYNFYKWKHSEFKVKLHYHLPYHFNQQYVCKKSMQIVNINNGISHYDYFLPDFYSYFFL